MSWKFCNADEAFAAWMAASAIGFGPLFSAFSFFNFCVTSNEIHEMSMCGCWCSTGISGWIDIGRFVYNFGALLKTTGVGSELYDFSGGVSFEWGINVGINAGGIGGGGTLLTNGGAEICLAVGCCWSFCWTWLYVFEPIIGRSWAGTNWLLRDVDADPEISASKLEIKLYFNELFFRFLKYSLTETSHLPYIYVFHPFFFLNTEIVRNFPISTEIKMFTFKKRFPNDNCCQMDIHLTMTLSG